MSTHVLVSDPSNISTRYSNADRLGFEGNEHDLEDLVEHHLAPDAEEELVGENKPIDFESISCYLKRIPVREADLIDLYHCQKLKQEQIAKLFGITQAAVSYRLHRGIRRIQFLRTIPELEKDVFQEELSPSFGEQDMEILWRMYLTTCQSEIAKQMKLTQGRVRHRFFRALQKLKDLIVEEAREKQIYLQTVRKNGKPEEEIQQAQQDLDNCINNSKYAKYWTVFFAISDKHFNILHEVSLPQFSNRGDAQIFPIE